MQSRRLRVASGLPDASAFYDELAAFGVSISDSGNDTYGARSGHDDLVLAVSYAVWKAESGSSVNEWIKYVRRQIEGRNADLEKAARTEAERREGLTPLQLARIDAHRARMAL